MKTRSRSNSVRNNDPANLKSQDKQRLRNAVLSSAAVLCLCAVSFTLWKQREAVTEAMKHVTVDFEYDESLGRLQFVSNMLPESTMVFLENNDAEDMMVFSPASADIKHVWNENEPWIEYDQVFGSVHACSTGEVMTVLRNHDDRYTVRMRHDDGYESLYSGLSDVRVSQFDLLPAGTPIGTADESASFELRKNGLSIDPPFDEESEP